MRRELSQGKPTVWVGKEGITPQIIKEINRQLERREVVKARMLKTALGTEEAKNVAEKIAQETESTLVDVKGRAFVLYKRKRQPIARQAT